MPDTKRKLVAIWCEDCQEAKRPDGTGFRVFTPSRCGVDYGEGFTSHLNTHPLYLEPFPIGA